jgi:hypothetical protein
MGASSWEYWVPYQAEVGVALEALRSEVFAAGTFYAGQGEHKVEGAQSIEELFARLDALGHADGTHSILDMTKIASEPGFGVAAPLTADQIDALFETQTPTRAQIEAARALLLEVREGGSGSYLIAYEGDEPKELYFFGFSGD